MTIIGIDPGQGGAIACWNKGIKSYKCPQNVETMAGIVEEFIFNSENIYAYIEKVHAMPQDGRSSIFIFGTLSLQIELIIFPVTAPSVQPIC